jgi:cysteine desulfurase/selenocysteine lyase
MSDHMIYLDNAATNFPKPQIVLERMVRDYNRLGVSPGRGSYDLASEAAEIVRQTRKKLAIFFGAPDHDRVIFASNATDGLNLAIQGIVKPGEHVVATRLEHNAVLRPLYHLKQHGWIEYDLVPFDASGFVDPDDIDRAIRKDTGLVVLNHASNVLGTLQPVAEIGRICTDKGVPLLIDAAQSAGQASIDITGWPVSAVAFTGHKSLLGPSGIGGLVVGPELEIDSTRFGGTGVESRSLIHTQEFPYRLEAGTLNLLGVIGLSAGLDYLQDEGMEHIHKREMALIRRLQEGLASLPGVTVYGPPPPKRKTPVLACNVKGMVAADVGAILDGDYGIAVRTGLHCAPLVHTDLGLIDHGTVRFSVGCFNTDEDINWALEAMVAISKIAYRDVHKND